MKKRTNLNVKDPKTVVIHLGSTMMVRLPKVVSQAPLNVALNIQIHVV